MNLRNCRWAVAAVLGLVGLASNASAQCTDYTITQVSGASIIPGTTDIGNHNDDATVAVSLPFNVNYYGTSYSTIYVCSNGFASFNPGVGAAFGNGCLPATGATGPTMFPFWDDLYTVDGTSGEGIFSSTLGAAPNRQFVIEWRTVYCCTGGAPINNFEIVLYENTGGFDFIYGAVADRASATIGVQQDGPAGSHFTSFECNTTEALQGLLLHFDCGTGACCLVDGTCSVVDRGACAANGGLYGGDNTTCGAHCQRPGACCMPNGTCSTTSASLCASAGGTYAGDGVTCAAANCPAGGACCDTAGNCSILTSAACAASGGLYHGDNTTCSTSACIGRCCSPDGTCSVTSQQSCSAIPGANYTAGLSSCGGTYLLTQGTTAIEDISTTGAILISSPADNGGVALNPTSGSLDDGSTFFTLPFAFSFYGNPQTQVNVGTNGYLTFDPVAGDGNSYVSSAGIPNAGTPNNMIGAPWCDFYLFNAGHIGTQVNGVSPNQRAIIQWTGIQYFPGTGAQTSTSTFQVILYETSNNVEIRIQALGEGTSTTLEPHVLGVENSDGSAAVSIPNDTATEGASYQFAFQGSCPTNSTGSCCTNSTCRVTSQADCPPGATWTAGGVCTGPASCAPACGSADFNCDGDIGTDSDINAFFACLSGNCPALPCISNADFNGDGDVGTDGDIEAFFRVLGGGHC